MAGGEGRDNEPQKRHKGRKGSKSSSDRGRSVLIKCAKAIKEKTPFPISWNSKREPCGENKSKLVSWIGICARNWVGIQHSKWGDSSKMERAEVLKQVKGAFKVEDKEKEDWCMLRAAEYWRKWKSRLHTEYMYEPCPTHSTEKGGDKVSCECERTIIREPPDEDYPQITQEQWDAFIAYHTSEAFLRASKSGKENIAKNKSQFYGSRGGYQDIEKKIIKEFADKGIHLKEGEVDRFLTWIRGHTPKGEKEMTDYDKAVLAKIKLLQKDVSAGKWKPEGRDDILHRAAGKPEHPGRVLSKATSMRFTDVWGKKAKPGETWEKTARTLKSHLREAFLIISQVSQGKKLSQEQIEYMAFVVDESQATCLFEEEEGHGKTRISDKEEWRGETRISDKEEGHGETRISDKEEGQGEIRISDKEEGHGEIRISDNEEGPRSPKEINVDHETSAQVVHSLGEDWVPCRLCLPDYNPPEAVAYGSIYIGEATQQHSVSMPPGFARVQIVKAMVPDAPLPRANEEQKIVKDVEGSFTAWPINQVFMTAMVNFFSSLYLFV